MFSAATNSAAMLSGIVGVLTVTGLTLSAGNPALGLLVIVVVPLLVFAMGTRELVSAIALVWLNEQLFGMSGTWATLGPVPGRGLLLCVLLLSFLSNVKCHHFFVSLPKKVHYIVVGYGIVLPIALLTFSTLVMGNPAGQAASDVIRFFGLLAFYPLAYVYRRMPGFLLSGISGASIAASLVFLFMSIGPYPIRWMMVDNWVFNGAGSEFAINYYRTTYEPMIYSYIGSFVGVLCLLTPTRKSMFAQATSKTVLGLLPTALNFLRGLLVSLAVVIVILLFSKINKRGYSLKVMRYFPLLVAIFVLSVFLILQNPFAQYKLQQMSNAISWSDHFGSNRALQINLALQTWLNYPVLGQGVGTPLAGYSNWKELSLEFQWGMILYRTGVVGFLLILAPFVMVLKYLLVSRPSTSNHYIYCQAIACTLLTVACASVFNPYLASSVTVTLFVLYLAIRSAPVPQEYPDYHRY